MKLYNYTTGEWDDLKAVPTGALERYLPQHPLVHNVYAITLARGNDAAHAFSNAAQVAARLPQELSVDACRTACACACGKCS